VYGGISDYEACLLVNEEKTYEFIRRVITSATRPFRTKRVHIGMDEAFRLGRGKYLDKNGFVPTYKIMRDHLAHVTEILRELELEPMMWSDMFFNGPDGSWYYNDMPVSQEAIDAVPEGMRLVYWDYYHNNSDEFYLKYIDKHRNFGEPIFAGGIWTWNGYGANWARTFNSTTYALSACKQRGIREVFATVWGDNDTECNVNATLLGLALFAEHNYCAETPDNEVIKQRFEYICKANYDDFMMMHKMDYITDDEAENLKTRNPSKVLMFQDILCGLYDKNIEGQPYDKHYAELAQYYDNARKRGGILDFMMDLNYNVCNTLALKAEMGLRITKAYKSGNKAELKNIMENDLPELRRRMNALCESHRISWLKTYKPLGFETFDARYGAAVNRINSAIVVIGMYLDGELETIAELDEPRLGFNGNDSDAFLNLSHSRIAFSHRIF